MSASSLATAHSRLRRFRRLYDRPIVVHALTGGTSARKRRFRYEPYVRLFTDDIPKDDVA